MVDLYQGSPREESLKAIMETPLFTNEYQIGATCFFS